MIPSTPLKLFFRFCQLSLLLTLTTLSAQTLTWNGGAGGAWDLTTANWLDSDNNPVLWSQGADAVILNTGKIFISPGIEVNNLTTNTTGGSGEVDLESGSLQISGTVSQEGTRKIHFRSTNITGSGAVAFNGSLSTESILVRSSHNFSGTLQLGGTGYMQMEGLFTNAPYLEFTSADNGMRMTTRTGNTKTFSGISGASTGNYINSDANVTLAANVADTESHTFAGSLGQSSGTLSLTMQGEGTQIFTGAMSYDGATTVQGGVLQIEGIHSGTGGINVENGELRLTASNEWRFVLQDEGISNQITGNGLAALDGTFRLDIDSLTTELGSWQLVDVGSLSETFGGTFGLKFMDGTEFDQSGNLYTSGDWTFDTTTGTLTAIPEPSTLVLLGLVGIAALTGLRRRK
ncbi:MAG: autotransporter-associated beta strand repeat-containing protein [Verrucomicrobia bacterium]|nr:autotransporter-associated beta strand repeat-containing protein [Verrucomicrobiota bacterium]MCH8512356.1 autotransporter-associated beta strand repeat-containing protein [Kiritimatiellia bacterium]